MTKLPVLIFDSGFFKNIIKTNMESTIDETQPLKEATKRFVTLANGKFDIHF